MKYESMFQRLLANSEAQEDQPCGCWTWARGLHTKGYGWLSKRVDGKHEKVYAHREMHRQIEGEFIEVYPDDTDPFGPILLIPRPQPHTDQETLDHLCWNTQCVNPDHFDVVTRAENTSRMRTR